VNNHREQHKSLCYIDKKVMQSDNFCIMWLHVKSYDGLGYLPSIMVLANKHPLLSSLKITRSREPRLDHDTE